MMVEPDDTVAEERLQRATILQLQRFGISMCNRVHRVWCVCVVFVCVYAMYM